MINREPKTSKCFQTIYIMNKAQKIFSYITATIMLCILIGALIVVAVYHLIVKKEIKEQKIEMIKDSSTPLDSIEKQRKIDEYSSRRFEALGKRRKIKQQIEEIETEKTLLEKSENQNDDKNRRIKEYNEQKENYETQLREQERIMNDCVHNMDLLDQFSD